MERLTLIDEHPCQFCDFSCKCEWWELSDEKKSFMCRIYNYFTKLKTYEDAEKHGQLVMLPCAPQETCYAVCELNCEIIDCPRQDDNGDCDNKCPNIVKKIPQPYRLSFETLLMLSPLYATREEAEAALKEG